MPAMGEGPCGLPGLGPSNRPPSLGARELSLGQGCQSRGLASLLCWGQEARS